MELLLLHGHVNDITSTKKAKAMEHKEKYEVRKKGVRTWVTVHYLIGYDESK